MKHSALTRYESEKLHLKNRAVVAPMSRVSTKGDGIPTAKMAEYYSQFAKGGFAMIVTEGTYTDRAYAQAYPNQPGITDQAQQNGWARVVESVHKHDSKIILQLMHAGALSQHLSNTRAPSRIEPMRKMLPGYSIKQGRYPTPHAMNLMDIDQVIEGYVQSAKRSVEAGFDGVEIHSANGYLLDQFITDYTNMREDMYGGSVENRIRLTCEIIKAVKQVTSERHIVGVRLSQGKVNDFDYLWPGGLSDGEIIFDAVKHAGADYIHFASEGKGFDHGCLTREGDSLPKLAKSLTNLPVIANGGMHNPQQAEHILHENHADLLALGTGALSNPDWPIRLENGENIEDFSGEYFKNGVNIDAH
ncbi:MAG: NADH:flavin oxidoreductase [Rickettsiales bacterium]|nr:NADH:flavin oxidoreductase [Rickettsiales bacterium]